MQIQWGLVALLVLGWVNTVRAQPRVAVMPLEGAAPPEIAAAVESNVVAGLAATVRGPIQGPQEVAALGCAQPACVARSSNVNLVVHMGVGNDRVLRADLFDATVQAVRTTVEEPLGPDAASAAAAARRLGERVGVTAQSLAVAHANAARQTAPQADPVQQAPPPPSMADPAHPVNSESPEVAWKWLWSTMGTLAFGACCSYGVAALFAAILAYFVYGVVNFINNPAGPSPFQGGCSNSACYALMVSPIGAVCCTATGCALTLGTLAMPVLFLRQRLKLMFSKQDATTSTTTARRSGPVAPVAPVAFVEPL